MKRTKFSTYRTFARSYVQAKEIYLKRVRKKYNKDKKTNVRIIKLKELSIPKRTKQRQFFVGTIKEWLKTD